jgi:hypothetical protein
MSNELNPKIDPDEPPVYQIRLKGHLGREWTDWFDGLVITLEEDGSTLLTGPVIDQAALHGLFKKVRDLGLTLISVNLVHPGLEDSTDVNQLNATHQNHSIKGEAMNTNIKATGNIDPKVMLSTLWIFAMFNYLYADVYTLFFSPVLDKQVMQQLLSGYVGSIQITQGFVVVTAVLMETAIAMVLLSRVLKYRANRWTNIIAGAFHTLFVAWSLIGSTPTLFYAFFAAIEIPCTLFIVWYAWKWINPEG